MTARKSVILWIISILLMLAIAVYQRLTGPTYPVSGSVQIAGKSIEFSLPRSHEGRTNQSIGIVAPDTSICGKYKYSKFSKGKAIEEWAIVDMTRSGDTLYAEIPGQRAAGKVIYQVYLYTATETVPLTEEPVIIRYTGFVPRYFLWPHIFFMFLAMCLSMRTGLQAIFKGSNLVKYTTWTIVAVVIGGVILGPIIQYCAFGKLWTGWPFGHDLTDTKTAAALILWIIALWRLKKKPESRGWVIAAAIVLLGVYLIPHSVLGSELDYTKESEKNKPEQGIDTVKGGNASEQPKFEKSEFCLHLATDLDFDGEKEIVELKHDSTAEEGDFYHLAVWKKVENNYKVVWEDSTKQYRFFIGDFGVEDLQLAGDIDKDGSIELISPNAISDVSPQGFRIYRWFNNKFTLAEEGYYLGKKLPDGSFDAENRDFVLTKDYDYDDVNAWNSWICKIIKVEKPGIVLAELWASDGSGLLTADVRMEKNEKKFTVLSWLKPWHQMEE